MYGIWHVLAPAKLILIQIIYVKKLDLQLLFCFTPFIIQSSGSYLSSRSKDPQLGAPKYLASVTISANTPAAVTAGPAPGPLMISGGDE